MKRWARRGFAIRFLALAMVLGAPARHEVRAEQARAGALRGTVSDKDFEVPVARAVITIVELRLATLAGPDGNFLFENVPAGTYTLTVNKDGYERAVVPGVVVRPGEMSEVGVTLSSEVVEMEELVIT